MTLWSVTKADEPQVLQAMAKFESELRENYRQWFSDGFKKILGPQALNETVMPPAPEKDESTAELIDRHVKKIAQTPLGLKHDTVSRASTIHGEFAQRTRKTQSTLSDLHGELLQKFHVESSDKEIWDYAGTLDDLHPGVEF